MKGGRWAILLAALLAAKGAGVLPQSREMEELKLITTLAMDGGEVVTVTAVTGVRVTEDEEPEVFTGTGGSLAEACRTLRESSSRRAYLGQTEQLLVGEGQDLAEALDFVLSDDELRMDTLLYIVRGEAGAALAVSAGQVAAETGGKDPRGRTVGEVMPRMAEGEYALVPALAPGEDGTLAPAGWAAVGPNGLAGYLEGDAAVGAALLAGAGGERVITLSGGAAEIVGVRTWAKGGKVCCTLTAKAAQGEPSQSELEEWGEQKIRSALALGWDCWGLDREMSALQPWNWKAWKGTDIRLLDVEVTGRLVGSNEGRK